MLMLLLWVSVCQCKMVDVPCAVCIAMQVGDGCAMQEGG